ncbi:MAG: hypothetical protein JW795_17660 [Chitinivibrionales bacterium]|nr:hypothetical protein [Chitinivibrionales bacterium]
MVKFPAIIWIGALVLGKVGGEMIITDPLIISTFLVELEIVEINHGIQTVDHLWVILAEAIAAFFILSISLVIRKKLKPKHPSASTLPDMAQPLLQNPEKKEDACL